jgi:hypothetical protein
MQWLTLILTLSGVRSARTRTAVWRSLRQVAAVPLGTGVYVLPDRAECRAAFETVATRIARDGGTATQLRSTALDPDEDARIVMRFHQERAALAEPLITALSGLRQPGARSMTMLRRITAQAQVIADKDYFDAPACQNLTTALKAARGRLERTVSAPPTDAPLARYRGRVWVTAARPSIDGLACAWLIRRFVDTSAQIRFGGVPRGAEVAFDLDSGEFAHHGNSCAFERMTFAFRLDAPALRLLGEVVHDLVMSDRRVRHPEAAGLAAAVRGWRRSGQLSAVELEARARALFDGLYADFDGRPIARR